jgi:hypothetical protein
MRTRDKVRDYEDAYKAAINHYLDLGVHVHFGRGIKDWREELQYAQQRIGRTPRKRLEWLVDSFLGNPLLKEEYPTKTERTDLYFELLAFFLDQRPGLLALPYHFEIPPDRQDWEELADVPSNLEYRLSSLVANNDLGPLESRGHWLFRLAPTRNKPIHVIKIYTAPLLEVLLLVASDLIETVGAHKLRTCPQLIGTVPCGRLFVAKRRQKFCSIQHARIAAYLAWKQRGSPRRKRKILRQAETATSSSPSVTAKEKRP